jgi:hypothetical protein
MMLLAMTVLLRRAMNDCGLPRLWHLAARSLK